MMWNSLGGHKHTLIHYKIYVELNDSKLDYDKRHGYARFDYTDKGSKRKWFFTKESHACVIYELKRALEYSHEAMKQLKAKRIEIVQCTETRLMYMERSDYDKWVSDEQEEVL